MPVIDQRNETGRIFVHGVCIDIPVHDPLYVFFNE